MLVSSFNLYMFMYMISFILVISCNDWFMVWFGLEINMLSFIVMIYQRFDMKSVESCLKYFFIQSLGSAMLISLIYYNSYMLGYFMMLVLAYKLGAGPFFFWFPSVCLGLSWMSCFILMTFQKIIPLMLMGVFMNDILLLIAFMSLIFGVFGSFNQISIKELLAYSSIHHLGWMMLCMMNNNFYFMIYLLMYSMIMLGIIYFLMKSEVINIINLYKFKEKWWFLVGMLSMAGIPPLLGFFLKWMAFHYIMFMGAFWLILLILMSVVMLYVYMRIIYDSIMGYNVMNNWFNFILSNKFIMFDMMNMLGVMLSLMLGVYLIV